MGGLLCISSVAEATDMQIYAAPSAGKKTIIMMLDTSGSMAYFDNPSCYYNYYGNTYLHGTGSYGSTTQRPYSRRYCKDSNGAVAGFDRLTNLKDGMFEFLNSSNPVLQSVRVGLGNYSANGDGRSGQILVPAEKLGAVGSTHREALKTAVKDLTASGGTPSAHAYAEAAAYLMGTNTVGVADIQVDVYKSETTRPVLRYTCPSNYPYLRTNVDPVRCYERYDSWRSQPYRGDNVVATPVYGSEITTYYRCDSLRSTDFDNGTQSCRSDGWSALSAMPNVSNLTLSNGVYTKIEQQVNNSGDSGFSSSASSTKTTTNYISPLPAVADRVSCDGQGVYFLSDGVPNSSSNSKSTSLMKAALGTLGANFNCTGGLTNTTNDSGWACMGEFAKKLYNKDTNPAGVSIQTAFVGFGSDFTNLSASSDVQNACRLSSRTQNDRTSDDACSPTGTSGYTVANPGYGNGGFYTTQTSEGVTNSVIDFINNLSKAPIDPLATGAVAVPVDSLDPSSFQEHGYLRALEPNPATPIMVWTGNLKKYSIVGGQLKYGSTSVFDTKGALNKNTKDNWNTSSSVDNGEVRKGGAYARLLMPTSTTFQTRPLFTDIASVSSGSVVKQTSGTLLSVPVRPVADNNGVLNAFATQATLKDFPLNLKLRLLNYLGYDLDLTSTTALPTTLTSPATPFISMGGSVHSFPVQLTYSGTLDEYGDLTDARTQSVLYGSAEGGIRIVNADTGVEQMVFVPADILNSTNANALRKGEGGSLVSGMDSTWISDASYKVTSSTQDGSTVAAKQMNVYGGMRMGGSSYYGLNVLSPSSPKLLFRVGADQSNYSRMGQTWSKPVVANVRYGGEIKRVLFVGGGYDMCYENPRFKLGSASNSNTDYPDTTCNNVNGSKTTAKGNAVYMIDATTGARLWWTSSSGSDTNNANITHSIPSRISTLDRDGDGLVDHLYFGDLGGQLFRADLNNTSGTTAANFGKRVVRMAELGATTDRTNGDQPRFFQPPTVTFHIDGTNRFIVLGIASGDRSTPLDVTPAVGREGMLPVSAMTARPDNNVYGIIDHDFSQKTLITGSPTLKSENIAMTQLQKDPQNVSGALTSLFFPATSSTKHGWYRSLSTVASGARVSGASLGGMKAFEDEPLAITNRLIVPVYDPDGKVMASNNPCSTRVIGETVIQQFCLPYGKCTDSTIVTGYDSDNVVASGIVGSVFVPIGDPLDGECKGENCKKFALLNQKGAPKGEWISNVILNPVRWYEKNIQGTD
ncbi:pilus assembly protein [Acinetobacter sedimenti]